MKILIVRHGDPDYSIDSLTSQGHTEAKLLADRLAKLNVKDFYVSPLGRAKHTAEYTLKKMGREAETLEWLKEFPTQIKRPDREGRPSIAWDWLPGDWCNEEKFYSHKDWTETPVMKQAEIAKEYSRVTGEFDKLLLKHGYERCGNYYNAVNANEDTIVLFCHFGLECVLLSHLLSISPMVLWQGFCAAPTSVTTIITEEREKGIAYFRVNAFGDTSHLYAAGEEPSFAARFCETYDNFDQRHN